MTQRSYIIYELRPNQKRATYWTGTGWTDVRRDAKVFRTEAEMEPVLRRMMVDNVKAHPSPIRSRKDKRPYYA